MENKPFKRDLQQVARNLLKETKPMTTPEERTAKQKEVVTLWKELHAEKALIGERDATICTLRGRNRELHKMLEEQAGVPDSKLDTQEGGDHYSKMGEYQPWIVSSKWMTPEELKGFMKGTVFAYLAREQDKGGDLDVEKAYHTMGIYLELKAKASGNE